MAIWKERENEVPYFQVVSDPTTIEALLNCRLLNYFRVPGMKSYVCLLEYIIGMWDPDQQHCVVGIHTLPIEIENIHFLAGLYRRGSPVVSYGAWRGETSLDDLIDQYYALGTES